LLLRLRSAASGARRLEEGLRLELLGEEEGMHGAAAEALLGSVRGLCHEARALATAAEDASSPSASASASPAAASGGGGGGHSAAARAFNCAEQLAECLAQLRPFWRPHEARAAAAAASSLCASPLARPICSPPSALPPPLQLGCLPADDDADCLTASPLDSRLSLGGGGGAAGGGSERARRGAEPVSISAFEILKPISRGAYGHVVLAAKKRPATCSSVPHRIRRSFIRSSPPRRRPEICTPSRLCGSATRGARTVCSASRRSGRFSRRRRIPLSCASSTPSSPRTTCTW